MAEEKDPNHTLIRVKADATGMDIAVGSGLPGLLARLLPIRWRLRRSADEAIVENILHKLRKDGVLDDAETEFAANMLSDQARKFVRLRSIQERASRLIEQKATPLLGPVGASAVESVSDTDGGETSDDWINKFREDASLVDDKLVREIYARVLSQEASRPGAFSLRTLGVLRYLDRETAAAFGRLQKVLVDGNLVPQQSPARDNILLAVGLDHTTMLMLNDAGLVNATANSQSASEGETVLFRLTGHTRLIGVRRPDGAPQKITLPVHVLTPTGIQLARIAESEPDESAFTSIVRWLRSHVADAELQVATLPWATWSGRADQLQWKVLGMDAAQPGVAPDGASPRR